MTSSFPNFSVLYLFVKKLITYHCQVKFGVIVQSVLLDVDFLVLFSGMK